MVGVLLFAAAVLAGCDARYQARAASPGDASARQPIAADAVPRQSLIESHSVARATVTLGGVVVAPADDPSTSQRTARFASE